MPLWPGIAGRGRWGLRCRPCPADQTPAREVIQNGLTPSSRTMLLGRDPLQAIEAKASNEAWPTGAGEGKKIAVGDLHWRTKSEKPASLSSRRPPRCQTGPGLGTPCGRSTRNRRGQTDSLVGRPGFTGRPGRGTNSAGFRGVLGARRQAHER